MFTHCLFINHCCLFNNNWNNNFKIQNYYGIEPNRFVKTIFTVCLSLKQNFEDSTSF